MGVEFSYSLSSQHITCHLFSIPHCLNVCSRFYIAGVFALHLLSLYLQLTLTITAILTLLSSSIGTTTRQGLKIHCNKNHVLIEHAFTLNPTYSWFSSPFNVLACLDCSSTQNKLTLVMSWKFVCILVSKSYIFHLLCFYYWAYGILQLYNIDIIFFSCNHQIIEWNCTKLYPLWGI